jgi:hypothetical protein
MPKASPLQPSFSGGEFSPRIFGRTDAEQYKTGLEVCLNYLPTIEGPIIRRPGFRYSGFDALDPSTPPTLVSYPVSGGSPFILEMGAGYVRFFRNGGAVQTINSSLSYTLGDLRYNASIANANGSYGSYSVNNNGPYYGTGSTAGAGSQLLMESPFNSSDIRELCLSFNQGDLYITTPRNPPYRLSRINDYSWSLTPIFPLLDGPYLPFNTDQSVGDKYNVGLQILNIPASFLNKSASVGLETTPKCGLTKYANQTSTLQTSYIIALSTVTDHNFYTGQKVIVDYSGQTGNFSILGTNPYSFVMCTVQSVINSKCVHVISDHTYGDGIGYGGAGQGSISQSAFIQPALVDKGYQLNRSIALSISGKRFWSYVGIIAASSSQYFLISLQESLLPSATNVTTWQLGSYYSTAQTSTVAFGKYWPRYNTFHQNRWVLSGSDLYPNEIAASMVGEFSDFRTSNSSYVVADNNALQFKLAGQNVIRWVASDANGLLVGTEASEWKVSPSSQATALTPTNINASESSYFGSEDVPPVKTGNAIVYVQKSGRRVRELNYFFQVNTYKSTNLSQLSEHITSPRVTALVNQRETIPAVWGLRSDGQLISMVYGRDDETLKAGWARHELGGQSDSGGSAPKVMSMAVVAGSSGSYDQLWVATKRFINGTSVLNIEYMDAPFQDDTPQEDSFFVDCGGTYDAPKEISNVTNVGSCIVTAATHGLSDGDNVLITKVVGLNTSVLDINGIEFNSNLVNYRVFRAASTTANTFFLTDANNGSSYILADGYSVYGGGGLARKLVSTITGFTWLKNETVQVLADGKVHPDVVVNSAGVLALTYAAAKVQVGLKYKSDAKTLRLDAGSGDGSAIGKIRRVSRAALQLYKVGEISVGMSFNKLIPVADVEQFKADNSFADVAPPLFSGIARESLESSHDFDGQICIRQEAPLPGMIQSITTILEENDV